MICSKISNNLEIKNEYNLSLPETWIETGKKAAAIGLMIVAIYFLPHYFAYWCVYKGVQWCTQRLIMLPLYPAQSSIFKKINPYFSTENLDAVREEALERLKNKGFLARHIYLKNQSSVYSGLLIGKPETIQNHKWVLQATGNAHPIECNPDIFASTYGQLNYNVLLVNNPGIGRSEGFATPETIGDCQETALRFLETMMKAHQIVLAGYSMGGSSIGQAIEKHAFPEEASKNYLVVRQVSFSSTSSVAGAFVKKAIPQWIVSSLVYWTGLEMDNVKSSNLLSQQGIHEAIIQANQDDIVPLEASLYGRFVDEPTDKECHLAGNQHNDSFPILLKTCEIIRNWEERNGMIPEERELNQTVKPCVIL